MRSFTFRRGIEKGETLMLGCVSVNENTERYASCNCCGSRDETPKLWDVRFTFNVNTQLVKLCEKHLTELKSEIIAIQQNETEG